MTTLTDRHAAVAVRTLTVRRGGRQVLTDVGFEVPPARVTGLLGPSGGGKTTLMRCIVGVQVVGSGSVTVLGQPAGSPGLRDQVGYVTQAPSVYGDLTVSENLRFFARVLGVPDTEVDRCIDVVDVRGHRHDLVARLSGGEQSRVSLAVALLGRPKLLVLDEPTVGLDPVLRQLRHDPRTAAMLLLLPCLILGLLWWMFHDQAVGFDVLGPPLLALIPFIVMFLVTSVTTLRERSSGTLERLLSMPTGKADLLVGYALAFGAVDAVQSTAAVALCVWALGLDVAGPVWMLVVVAVADAVLGSALGLYVSAFARTEFQAVQFMPAIVIPQILLCGLFVARDQLPTVLHWVSDVLPLSYAVDAMSAVTGTASGLVLGVASAVWIDLGVVLGFTLAALGLGAATLRRRTA